MNSSLKHIVLQLEDLTQQDISIDLGLDLLESSAKPRRDVIMINVQYTYIIRTIVVHGVFTCLHM